MAHWDELVRPTGRGPGAAFSRSKSSHSLRQGTLHGVHGLRPPTWFVVSGSRYAHGGQQSGGVDVPALARVNGMTGQDCPTAISVNARSAGRRAGVRAVKNSRVGVVRWADEVWLSSTTSARRLSFCCGFSAMIQSSQLEEKKARREPERTSRAK